MIAIIKSRFGKIDDDQVRMKICDFSMHQPDVVGIASRKMQFRRVKVRVENFIEQLFVELRARLAVPHDNRFGRTWILCKQKAFEMKTREVLRGVALPHQTPKQ